MYFNGNINVMYVSYTGTYMKIFSTQKLNQKIYFVVIKLRQVDDVLHMQSGISKAFNTVLE